MDDSPHLVALKYTITANNYDVQHTQNTHAKT